MTITMMYGFRYRGNIYSIEVSFHSTIECSFPSYYQRAVKDVFRRYSRDQIEAALDNVRANTPTLLNVRSHNWYKDVAVVPTVDDNDLEYLELRENAKQAMVDAFGDCWTAREKVPTVHRFEDVFARGSIIKLQDDDDPALHQIDNDEWLTWLFNGSRWGGGVYTPRLAFLIDLDTDRLVHLVNLNAGCAFPNMIPPEHIIHQDRAPPPEAKFPALVLESENVGRYYEIGAYYLTTPLSELLE